MVFVHNFPLPNLYYARLLFKQTKKWCIGADPMDAVPQKLGRKITLLQLMSSLVVKEIYNVLQKIALHEINTSRYNEEFYEVCKLGDGEYGSVFKCVHRLDGCTYAIKKSKTPVAGSVYE